MSGEGRSNYNGDLTKKRLSEMVIRCSLEKKKKPVKPASNIDLWKRGEEEGFEKRVQCDVHWQKLQE